MDQPAQQLQLCQVALSGRKRFEEIEPWYVGGLGFETAGGTHFAGAELASFAGIDAPSVDVNLSWLVGRHDFVQLEYFDFKEPETRPKREDWTPADVGYNVLGIHVLEFDATLARLADLGSEPIGPVVGVVGDRRACVLDPNGALLELLEKDLSTPAERTPARPDVNAAVRFVRASVRDLARSHRFFVETLRLEPVSVQLHGEEHEAGWGLERAPQKTEVLAAGNCFLELVEYADGLGRERPDGYRISDEGILNIACGSPEAEPVRQVRDRIQAGPYVLHDDMWSPELECNYVTDDQGFSVEVLYMGIPKRAEFGFV